MRLGDAIKSLGTAEIDVFGAKVRVRALSAREHAAIRDQTPDPPMLSSVDERGNKSLDPMHPTTVRLRSRQGDLRGAIKVGAGTGHAHPVHGPWSETFSVKQAEEYGEDVLGTVAPQVINVIDNAMDLLSMGVDPSRTPERERIGDATTPGFASAPPLSGSGAPQMTETGSSPPASAG